MNEGVRRNFKEDRATARQRSHSKLYCILPFGHKYGLRRGSRAGAGHGAGANEDGHGEQYLYLAVASEYRYPDTDIRMSCS